MESYFYEKYDEEENFTDYDNTGSAVVVNFCNGLCR